MSSAGSGIDGAACGHVPTAHDCARSDCLAVHHAAASRTADGHPRARSRDADRGTVRRHAAGGSWCRRDQGRAPGPRRFPPLDRALRRRLLPLLGRGRAQSPLDHPRPAPAPRPGVAQAARRDRRCRGREFSAGHARGLGAGLRGACGGQPGDRAGPGIGLRPGRSLPRPPGARPQRYRAGRAAVRDRLSRSASGSAWRRGR